MILYVIKYTILQLTKVTLIYTIFSTIYRNISRTKQKRPHRKKVNSIREIQPFEPDMDTILASHHVNTTIHAARKSYVLRCNMHVCHGIRRSELDNIRETCQQNGWKYVDPFDAQNQDEFLLLHRQNKNRLPVVLCGCMAAVVAWPLLLRVCYYCVLRGCCCCVAAVVACCVAAVVAWLLLLRVAWLLLLRVAWLLLLRR